MTLHPTPYTLHLTPYTLRPKSYTPHPTPYTLHPTPLKPFTPHPTPYTLTPRGRERTRRTKSPALSNGLRFMRAGITCVLGFRLRVG